MGEYQAEQPLSHMGKVFLVSLETAKLSSFAAVLVCISPSQSAASVALLLASLWCCQPSGVCHHARCAVQLFIAWVGFPW